MAIAVAVAVLAAGIPASAHDRSFKTRITISQPEPFAYQGRVFSKLDACVRRREIQMWRDQPGADEKVGVPFRADRRGRWSYGFFGKQYYVVAKRAVKRSGNHRHVCRADRSPTV